MPPDPSLQRYCVLWHELPDEPHYDFMVTADGEELLRTWRVAVPPVMWSEAGALIMQPLPAHRRIYLDYEGPVSGNRGAVTRVAEGQCIWRVGSVPTLDMTTGILAGLRLIWLKPNSVAVQLSPGGGA